MKIINTCIISLSQIKIVVLFLSLLILSKVNGQANTNDKNSLASTTISEEKFVKINNLEHWVTINGDRSKPVILFLHGGPGSPLSPYSERLYKDLAKDFIIVQWDQRGTAKTFGQYAPEELTPEYLKENPLSLDLMTTDGIQLSEYLLKYLNKQKIILFGTSWGSALGVKMASKRPELYYAYVGHAQIVNPNIDLDFYSKIYKLAELKNDKDAIDLLNTIGKPPYDRARKAGQLFRIVKKYEAMVSAPAPDNWFEVSAKYDNEKDNQNRSDGDDYSFVNYVGDQKLDVQPMNVNIDFIRDNLNFKIPIYLIQGNEDLLTPKEKTKEYFDKITAPKKEYFLLPNTAHGFNLSILEIQFKIFKSIKTK